MGSIKKKNGSALVFVLIIATALIMMTTAISAMVIQSAKINNKYIETEDTEFAVKSAINIAKDYLVSKINESPTVVAVENINTDISTSSNYNSLVDYNIMEYLNISSPTKENITLPTLADGTERTGKKLTFNITAKAKNSETVATETVVIKIEDERVVVENPITGLPDILKFDKLMNVGNNVILKNNNGTIVKNLSYGQTISCKHGSTQDAQRDENLSKIEVNINLSKINEYFDFIDDFKIKKGSYKNEGFNSIIIDGNTNKINLTNSRVKYNIEGEREYLSNISISLLNSTLMFDNKVNLTNDPVIVMNNSQLLFNNDVTFNKLNNFNIKNSIMIVNGNLTIDNDFTINSESTGNIIIVRGNLDLKTNNNLYLDNSIIIVGGYLSAKNNLNITTNDSAIIVKGNIGSDSEEINNMNLNNKGKSFIFSTGSLYIKNNGEANDNTSTIPESAVVIKAINDYLTIKQN